MGKTNLDKAKKAKNDEFYTKRVDVENGLKLYDLRGKRVLCPCDHYKDSEFYKYLKENYHKLGLAGLVATSISGTRAEYNGSEERVIYVIEIPFQLSMAEEDYDVCITNPPYSKIHDFYALAKRKQFIFLGMVNQLKYTDIVPDFFNGELFVGYNTSNMKFDTPDGEKGIPNAVFLSNIPPTHKPYKRPKAYKPQDHYDTIDGTDTIFIERSEYIPKNYKGVMAVPLSFISFWNPEEYEIVGIARNPSVCGRVRFDRWLIKEV